MLDSPAHRILGYALNTAYHQVTTVQCEEYLEVDYNNFTSHSNFSYSDNGICITMLTLLWISELLVVRSC